MQSNSRALVVLSGGQDSTTCLFWAKKHFEEVRAITFNYGQRHEAEILAAVRVAEMADVSHEILSFWEGTLQGRSFLTDKNAEVEEFDNFEEMDQANAFKENKLDSSFVPMRNALFLTVAANRAYVYGCDTVVTGVTAADFVEYGEVTGPWLSGFLHACGEIEGNWIRVRLADPDAIRRINAYLRTLTTDKFQECDGGYMIAKRVFTWLPLNGANDYEAGKVEGLMLSGKIQPYIDKDLRSYFVLLDTFRVLAEKSHQAGMNFGCFNPPYPDCSPDFIFRMQQAINEALRVPQLPEVKISTPLLYKTKAQAVRMAYEMPDCWAALAFSHTSYDGKYPPTGRNHANLLRAQGFEDAGLPDPLVLRAASEGLMKVPETDNYKGEG